MMHNVLPIWEASEDLGAFLQAINKWCMRVIPTPAPKIMELLSFPR